jgi:hypothetical protein
MYRIIRLSAAYDITVVKNIKDNTYYVNSFRFDKNEFMKISKVEADHYFHGLSDHMGFGKIPDRNFETLVDVKDFTKTNRIKYYENQIKEEQNPKIVELFKEIIDLIKKE